MQIKPVMRASWYGLSQRVRGTERSDTEGKCCPQGVFKASVEDEVKLSACAALGQPPVYVEVFTESTINLLSHSLLPILLIISIQTNRTNSRRNNSS